MKAFLIGESYKVKDRIFRLTGRTMDVGRTQGDLLLPYGSVSRRHAALESRTEGWLLVDRNSRNGTFVNGVGIVRRLLQDADNVRFGEVAFSYRESEDDPELDRAGASRASDLARIPAENDETFSGDDTPTRALPVDRQLSGGTGHLNALSALRHLAQPECSTLEGALDRVLDDLLGICDVRRGMLCLSLQKNAPEPRWIQAGGSGNDAIRRRMLDALRTGREITTHSGRNIRAQGDCDAICLPLRDAVAPIGSLFIEGENALSTVVLEALRSVAIGIGIGVGIWRKAACGVQQTRSGAHRTGPSALVGRSEALQKSVQMALRAASSDSTVLLRGESGTGKELFARLIYSESARREGPLVAVHCSAIEDTLLGSTLFGHEKGAFTGAVGLKKGLFEAADKGTIFLDEVGELSLEMQVKLLRVLQEGEFMRVGSTQSIKVDVRVIAATNRDLEKAMQTGAFREDLYYRLKVIQIDLPSLREHREDIPDLVRHFMNELSESLSTGAREVSADAMRMLSGYAWPGNVRELRNIVERSLVLAEGAQIEADDLPPELCVSPGAAALGDGALSDMEHRHIVKVLEACNGNKRLAAQRLGISRSTLYEKLKEP